jgi:UDP-N-acetylglucosamine:LPS N-acetylglucosamine transferase
MVLVDAVAGCEDYNMRYFQDLGGAVAAKHPKEIAELCLELLASGTQLTQMRENLMAYRKNGAAVICDYLLSHQK